MEYNEINENEAIISGVVNLKLSSTFSKTNIENILTL